MHPPPWFFLSKKFNFVFCEIPKAGSGNWHSVLIELDRIAVIIDFMQLITIRPSDVSTRGDWGLEPPPPRRLVPNVT